MILQAEFPIIKCSICGSTNIARRLSDSGLVCLDCKHGEPRKNPYETTTSSVTWTTPQVPREITF